jgi:hybrid cluster-associated redox disulfide protein
MRFSKEMTVEAALKKDSRVAKVLAKFGMVCKGCGGAAADTIVVAAKTHRVDPDELVSELNKLGPRSAAKKK